jgi:hypothetical protein
MIMHNSAGRKDYILSMTVWGFAIIMIKFILGGVSLTAGPISTVFASPDPAFIASVWGPLLAAYVARRYTDRNFQHKDLAIESVPVPAPQPGQVIIKPPVINNVDGPDLQNL